MSEGKVKADGKQITMPLFDKGLLKAAEEMAEPLAEPDLIVSAAGLHTSACSVQRFDSAQSGASTLLSAALRQGSLRPCSVQAAQVAGPIISSVDIHNSTENSKREEGLVRPAVHGRQHLVFKGGMPGKGGGSGDKRLFAAGSIHTSPKTPQEGEV
jgi:hypothetical protein